ncbi:charged multivesicular body protein 4c-like [Xenia sp. Carnegie-2017]|uniref:charged multivesicular body protein 4c-like n=1 Tax=Xenia sp. Carnegie-2017 TaxID=2897299 RepID=UPI001F04CCAC|nr:charged multivesicular body protein 4c-like [Xenia sp. Carnegie-2017]
MSFLARAFGAGPSKKEHGPSTQEAIQRLRTTEEMLQKKSDYLEKKIDSETNIARSNASKNKRAALNALKRKKALEKQLAQIDGTLSTIEFQRQALENSNTNTEVLSSMKYAASALKQAQQLDVDDVHDMMDDISEQHEIANEIASAISNPIGFGVDIDEDELNAELEELEQEELDERMLEVGGASQLPSVPNTEVPVPAGRAKRKLLPMMMMTWLNLKHGRLKTYDELHQQLDKVLMM